MRPFRTPRTAISHPLTRENRHAFPAHRALPRHHLAEVRARLTEVGVGPFRNMTCLRTADVGAVREVFVTPTNMDRGSDTFNFWGWVSSWFDGVSSQSGLRCLCSTPVGGYRR